MKTHARLLTPATLALLTSVCAPAAFPQSERAPAAREQAEAQRNQAELRRELQKAREQLQAAARDVARLSAQLVDPVVKDVTRQFRFGPPRGVLGVAIEDTELGARITGVTPNGPGADAGLAIGDTIVAMDGAELATPPAAGAARQSPSQVLLGQMASVAPGDDVELRVLRGGDYRTVHVKARAQQWNSFLPDMRNLPGPGSWPDMFWRHNPWADLKLATLSPGLGQYFGTSEGLLVVRAPENAAVALMDGDVILEIGGRKPTSPEHAMRILASFEPGETLRVVVLRHQKRETLEGKVPAEARR